MVEDVVTTGGQVVLSTQQLRERGALVSTAAGVIDREEGAREALAAIGVTLRPLFRRSQIQTDRRRYRTPNRVRWIGTSCSPSATLRLVRRLMVFVALVAVACVSTPSVEAFCEQAAPVRVPVRYRHVSLGSARCEDRLSPPDGGSYHEVEQNQS